MIQAINDDIVYSGAELDSTFQYLQELATTLGLDVNNLGQDDFDKLFIHLSSKLNDLHTQGYKAIEGRKLIANAIKDETSDIRKIINYLQYISNIGKVLDPFVVNGNKGFRFDRNLETQLIGNNNKSLKSSIEFFINQYIGVIVSSVSMSDLNEKLNNVSNKVSSTMLYKFAQDLLQWEDYSGKGFEPRTIPLNLIKTTVLNALFDNVDGLERILDQPGQN
ncbi:MAG: hypothetical protein Fur003_5840 [Candidatus Dojkabacteria bacterium]